MRRLLVLTGVVLLFAACAAPPAETPVVAETEQAPAHTQSEVVTEPTWLEKQLDAVLPEGHTVGEGVQVGDVKILPLLNPNAPRETAYITLHEAMEAELCTVTEQENVNEVLVTNRADSPLFLMVGDLILGGDQDRVMAESVVIEPGAEFAPVPVFCVEPHRWGTEEGNEKSAKGEFYSRKDARQVDLKVKSAALATADQSEVWDAVGKVNRALAVKDAEGSFREAYDDDSTATKLKALYEAAKQTKIEGAVGFVVVRGEEVIAMDVFDSPALFNKLSDNLLRSYLVTVASVQNARSGVGPSIEYVDERSEDVGDVTLAQYEDWLRNSQRSHALEASRTTPLSAEDAAVRRALENVEAVIEFDDVPLEDVIDWIRTHARINVIRTQAVDGDMEVYLDIGTIKMRHLLDLLCDSLDLRWVVRNGAVVISEPGEAPQTNSINPGTETTRRTAHRAVQYTCTDTKRKSTVHRSFMRR